ncbi:terpene synthase [Streptomyces sp. V4I8]|uniref:terpene synthase family protein n=1 Tax=Streptomyces sp. V4I8 TaxID=3156469 RepID=UPI003514EB74
MEGALPEVAAVRLAGLLPYLEEPQSVAPYQFNEPTREAGSPVACAVRDALHHANVLGTPAQVGRLRREYVAMCLAMAGESSYRVAQRTPTLWEYLAQRPFNGAMACLAAIDVAEGYELSARDYDRPDVRALTLLASSLILHVNDLYSSHKESVSRARTTSLPTLFCTELGRTTEEAVSEVVRLHNQQMQIYLAREEEIAAYASPELSRYLTGLRGWIGGSLQWHAMTGRYHKREGRPSPSGFLPAR